MTICDLINGLRHTADDHPCCRETLLEATRAIERGEYAVRLLTRWHEWARAHGHDNGIMDDTRAFLQPNVVMSQPAPKAKPEAGPSENCDI